MVSSKTNMVMTVIGFGLSVIFIVFVCTRLIIARIYLHMSRRRSTSSNLSRLERGSHGGLDPTMNVSSFHTKNYAELCLSSKENPQCTICLSEYENEDTLRILPYCKHSFHSKCIDIWLKENRTCPVCRVSLDQRKKWFMQPMFCSALRSQSDCI